MSIAQQVDTIYSQSEKIFCPLSKQEIEELQIQGQLDPSNNRIYQMEYMAQLLQVQCPYILQEDGSYVLVLSTEKFPYRRYPSHVYLYAAILHILGWSMRESARRCRRLFAWPDFRTAQSAAFSSAWMLLSASWKSWLKKGCPKRQGPMNSRV